MKIQVCTGRSCRGRFSEYILRRLNGDIQKFDLKNIETEVCACLGHCQIGPNTVVDGKVEHYCDPAKVSKIMFEKINARKNNTPNNKK